MSPLKSKMYHNVSKFNSEKLLKRMDAIMQLTQHSSPNLNRLVFTFAMKREVIRKFHVVTV